MKMLFGFIALFALSLSAHAQSSTEFFHQPNVGVSELTPHVGYRTSTTRAAAAGSAERNLSGLDRLGVTYEYGLNPMIALGADLSYSTYTISNGGVDSRGLEPLRIFLDGQLPMTMGSLQYGLIGSIGLEKAKSASDVANRSWGDPLIDYPAGGFKLSPYLGYAFTTAIGSVGARISYEVINSDVKVDMAAGEATAGGGSEGRLAAFYETMAADVKIGGAITYDWFTRVWLDAGAGETTLVGSHSLIGLKLYSALPFGSFDFLPSLSWREKAGGDDFDKTGDLHFTIAGRFAL